MKLQIKNCKINLTFSEETIMFKADVYINGKKCAHADNDGRGGCTFVRPYPGCADIVNEADKYFKSLPDELIKHSAGDFTFRRSLEFAIDDLVYDMVNKKEKDAFDKKMKRDMVKGLVVSNDNLKSYKVVKWKSLKIPELLMHEKGQDAVKKTIDKYRKDGYTVYNTNIPNHILN